MTRPAHRDPNVLRWVCAYAASISGDVVYFIALSWAAVAVAGPSAAGLVTAVGALPRLLLMLVGGVVADRVGPRRMVIVSDSARCVLVLAAAGGLWLAAPGLWLLLPLAAAFGVLDALFMPAVGALPPRIAPAEQLGRVVAMRALAVRAGNLAGPIIAGVALATGRVAVPFGVSAGLFLLSVPLLLAVRTRPLAEEVDRTERTGRPDLTDGFRYLRRHQVLGPLLAAIALSEMCFSGTILLAMVLLVDARGWGASAVGWLLGAFSVGAAAGALAVAVRPHVRRAGLVCAGLFAVAAGATAAVPAIPGLLAATCLVAVLGAVTAVAGVIAHTLVQVHTAPEYLGRVTSVLMLGTVGTAPLLFPLTGVAAAEWGVGTVFLVCAVITLAATVVMVGNRTLRHAAS